MSDQPFIPLTPADPLKTAFHDCSDYGNALRLVAVAGRQLVWVEDLECFAWYDGKRWSLERGRIEADRLAHAVIAHIDKEVMALAEIAEDGAALERALGWKCSPEMAAERVKTLRGHVVKSGNAGPTAGMLKQVRSLLAVRSDDFDRDPLAFNMINGTLRFAKLDGSAKPVGKLMVKGGGWGAWFAPHDPLDMLMQIASVEFDPKARCPMWEERLALVQPDDEQRGSFPRMYGQTLTGLTDCEEFYVHKGRGGDGKTKTHEIIADLLGDYCRKAAIKTFLQASFQKSGAEHRSDLVRLRGDIRMVLCDEPAPRVTWDGELLKQFTGGSTITARPPNARDEITFKPRGKLFIEVNPLPNMPGDDKGFRRRLRIILWPIDLSKIPGGFEAPEVLRKRLLTEKSGVLNWMIAGCLEWLADRRVPMSAGEAMAQQNFWAESSPLGEWLDERCDLSDADAVTSSKELWEDFKAWMEINEVPVEKWNTTRFGKDLMQRQLLGKKDRRGNKVRKGIRLRKPNEMLSEDRDDRVVGGEAISGPPPAPPPGGYDHYFGADDDGPDGEQGGSAS